MDKIQTAYHEAGHAVVAHFSGLVFESVSIIEDEESWGRVRTPLPEGFQPDEQREGTTEFLENRLAVCLAGVAAQEMFTGEVAEIGGNDLSGATTIAGSLGGTSEEMSAASDKAEERAKNILRDEWASVEALAAMLTEQEELNGEQAVTVIEGRAG